ncbi:helicase HerA-like domain-containing protein [Pokkaliibacter plantistimulans]|nr:helicase HerA-like domain-containing protein [Pokkaliibacter plantistimulans]
MQEQGILIGGSLSSGMAQETLPVLQLNPRYANRHGLVAGATGTGKTVTIQGLAERFSRLGVPVFVADVKGDLSGIAAPGKPHPKVAERVTKLGLQDFQFAECPAVFWDVLGEKGFPVRVSLSELGPQLLARLLELNDTQEGVLTQAFEYADDEGMLMLDLNDLKTTLNYLAEHNPTADQGFTRIAKSTVSAILRRLLLLEREGAEQFFGEPALQIEDLIRCDDNGQGIVNVLAAEKLIQTPRIYSTFLLWLLSELFENLPEVGDQPKPRFVFFFDEAHLLFNGAPRAFVEKVEQVVRLIRSKGVGIYFISQSPADIPDVILGQLGNRIQHALRAYTPKDQKAVRVAAQTFRSNPALDTETVITELGVGEALVSVLEHDGVPGMVQRTLIAPPATQIGPLDDGTRKQLNALDALAGKYETPVDPHSAHEILQQRMHQQAAQHATTAPTSTAGRSAGRQRESVAESFMKSIARAVGSQLGRQIIRGVLGSILKR